MADGARLHAGLELEFRWDSMAGIGQFEGQRFGELVLNPPDLVLHLRPGLRLEAPGAQAAFTGAARLDYARYSGAVADTSGLSFLGVAADAQLAFGKDGPASFTVADHFSRSDRTTNPSLGLGSITDANSAEARLDLRPGGGALEAGLGYAFVFETYEFDRRGACPPPTCDATKYPGFASQTHRFSLDARWRFLPKTAFVIEAAVAPRSYSAASGNVTTAPLRAVGGLAGLLTEKVRLALKAGYANTFAGAGQNFAGLVGQVEVGWLPRETATLTLGLSRSAEAVSDVYGWYDDLRAYASASMLLGGRLALSASFAFDVLRFGNQDRIDTQVQASVSAEWELHALLRVAVGEVLAARDSNAGFAYTFTRSETFARLTLAY